IVVQRDAVVFTLDQASAGRVVVRRGQGQTGVFRQRIDGLHQALAKGGFTSDEAAIVILNGARDDLSRRCGATIYEDNQRILFAAVAVSGAVNLLRAGTAMVRDDDLSLLEELVGYAYAFAQ